MYLVMGLGKTGLSVLRFLLRQGERVLVYDDRLKERDLPSWIGTCPLATFVSLQEMERVLPSIDRCVVSPGIHPDHPLVRLLEERKISIVSEVEFASQYVSFPLVGITGSCGKSTTVSLIGEILTKAGYHTFVGGNLGVPLIESVMGEASPDIGIVELSSFQLERVYTTRFIIAGVLNLYPNHLDYHPDMEGYFRAKGRIFLNQRPQDFALFLLSRPSWQARWCRTARGKIVPLGIGTHLFEGFYVEGQTVWQGGTPPQKLLSLEGCSLQGNHNLENILVAVATARLLGIGEDIIERVLRSFQGLPHRLELVGEWGGVRCYNDSKSTTPSSTRAAIEALPGPLIIILGGKAKLNDFSELAEALKPGKVRCAVLYGVSREIIEAFLPSWVKRYSVESLEEAVKIAWREARAGDAILLSPACTSWDAYENFEVRGEHFKRLVRTLGEGTPSEPS